MSLEVNLATYDNQKKILRKAKSEGVGYFYMLASFDSFSSQHQIDALKGLHHINNIKQSEVARMAFNRSSLCVSLAGGWI